MKINLNYLFLSIIALFLVSCSREKPKPEMPPAPVNTISVKSANLVLSYTYPAMLTSEKDTVLKAKVSGSIEQKYFNPGDKVKKGQKLFLIEPDKYMAAANIAKATLSVANANHKNIKADHERNEILFSKNAISQKEYDASLANFNSAVANLESAKAQYESAQVDLAYTNVEAPFDGIVGDSFVNIGQFVVASNSDLVRITNLDPIYADFYISDKEKLKLDEKLQSGNVEIYNTSAKINVFGKEYTGRISFIDSVIDKNSANVKVKAIFDNEKGLLLPGTFTNITMSGFVQKNSFEIPQIAVLQDQKQAYVYTIEQGKVKKTPITIVYQNNEKVVVDSGLKNGDKIIIDNFKKIAPGASVQDLGSN